MAANLLKKLQEAEMACEEITKKDFNNEKEQIALQFNSLRESIYKIIDEKTMILSTLAWQWEEKEEFNGEISISEILENEAKKISILYGFSFEAVYEILQVQNKFNASCTKKEHLIDPNTYVYGYWTFAY